MPVSAINFGQKTSGFSLLEVLIVVVLVAILSHGAGLLIATPINAYGDQERRTRLVLKADQAIRHIAREIRRALPNSIRSNAASGFALEFIASIDGARYRDEFGGSFNLEADRLLIATADDEFNILGAFNNLNSGQSFANRLAIYSNDADSVYADAANNNNPGRITPSSIGFNLSQNGIEQHLQLDAPFVFSQQSPTQRIFVVDQPVSYLCDLNSGEIRRYQGYGFQVTQPTSFTALGDVLVDQVVGCQLIYFAGSSQRGGILTLTLTLAEDGEQVRLVHQVHVENVP